MKKITLLLAGLMASGMASAVQLEASGNVTIADCGLLNEDVRINLSTGVNAGVDCSPTIIAMSACHTAGKQTSRTVNLREVTVTDSRGEDVVRKIPCALTETGCATETVTGPATPTASTEQGTVITQYPGGTECTAVVAEGNATNNL